MNNEKTNSPKRIPAWKYALSTAVGAGAGAAGMHVIDNAKTAESVESRDTTSLSFIKKYGFSLEEYADLYPSAAITASDRVTLTIDANTEAAKNIKAIVITPYNAEILYNNGGIETRGFDLRRGPHGIGKEYYEATTVNIAVEGTFDTKHATSTPSNPIKVVVANEDWQKRKLHVNFVETDPTSQLARLIPNQNRTIGRQFIVDISKATANKTEIFNYSNMPVVIAGLDQQRAEIVGAATGSTFRAGEGAIHRQTIGLGKHLSVSCDSNSPLGFQLSDGSNIHWDKMGTPQSEKAPASAGRGR